MLFILETCYNSYFPYLRGFLVDMLISWMKYQMKVIKHSYYNQSTESTDRWWWRKTLKT